MKMIFRGKARRGAGGFTLLEAVVAFAILVLATVGMLWSRTAAVRDAAEARNLRLAVKIAQECLCHLQAGMNEEDITELNLWRERENYPDFYVRVITGEDEISYFETELAEADDNEDRLRQLDLKERVREDELNRRIDNAPEGEIVTEDEELPLDEENFEEVVIAIRYPSLDLENHPDGLATFVLRVSLTTLALSGKTPEQAADSNDAAGFGTEDGGGGGSGGGGSGSMGGTSTGGDR